MTASGGVQQSVNLLQFSLGGERVRRAASILEREAPRIAGALRRALPFLARRDVPIQVSYSRAVAPSELMASLVVPTHVTHLLVTPGGGAGSLFFDAVAVGLFLDGVLGGDGSQVPELSASGLTAAQSALVSGLASGIVRAVSESLTASIGVGLSCRSAEAQDGSTAGAAVTCLLEIGQGGAVGKVAITLAKEPLLASCQEVACSEATGDARVVSVLQDVELDLVAELASLRLRLCDLARLSVGDTLQLDATVGDTVSVRAQGTELFRGRPTTSGGRIALKLAAGHED
jgi:flagellar motor switch protein FliM